MPYGQPGVPQPGAAPTDGSGTDAFGFAPSDVERDEKYNTMYLVGSMQKQRRTTQMILIGVVVNNAILIVHQSLNFMRGDDSDSVYSDPMEPTDAIVTALLLALVNV